MEAYATTTTLILLDVPTSTSITLDDLAFTSTTSFRGIKLIGEGIHLLTYGLDKSELGMRNGLFFLGRPGNVLAFKWDTKTEQLTRVEEQVQGRELKERILSSESSPPDGRSGSHSSIFNHRSTSIRGGEDDVVPFNLLHHRRTT